MTARRGASHRSNESDLAGVRLTSPDRVLYPEQGITKLALALYYEAIAPAILPLVAGRPLMLLRCPAGRGKHCFFQKHATGGLPEAVRSVAIREEDGEVEPCLYVEDLAGLVSLVQMGTLEVHGWGSRADDVERPDRLVFDLDPDPALPWRAVVGAARELRARLADLGLESWPTTTGGKGLHVVVPLARRHTWEVVKATARAVAASLARDEPDRYLTKAGKAERRGRIFIDWLRNARGATAIVPYSTRARAGAPVATPVAWEEIADLDPRELDVASVRRRLARQRRDPWQDFGRTRQTIRRGARRALGLE